VIALSGWITALAFFLVLLAACRKIETLMWDQYEGERKEVVSVESLDAEHGETDNVNHPAHYTSHPSGIEVLELTRLMPFGPGNALKYVLRRDMKGRPLEDLEKAEFYIRDSMDRKISFVSSDLLIRLARDMATMEDNATVASFIMALCAKGDGSPLSALRKTPDYELARDLLAALKEEYK
jgi:hypothetical protein